MTTPIVTNIQVVDSNKFTRERVVTWDMPTVPVLGFNIWRSEISYGDFEKLNTSLIPPTTNSYTDSAVPSTAIMPFIWWYKITVVYPGNQESNLASTFPATDQNIRYFETAPFDQLEPKALSEQDETQPNDGSKFQILSNTSVNPRWFLEIRKRHKWILQMGGTVVTLLKRRYSGSLCPLYDVLRSQHPQRANVSSNDPCYGTGFVGGYHQPIDILVSFVTPVVKKATRMEAGMWFDFEPKNWTLWEPNLLDRDILVRKDTGQRFEVQGISRTTWRGLTLRQNFDTRLLEPGSIEYKFQLP